MTKRILDELATFKTHNISVVQIGMSLAALEQLRQEVKERTGVDVIKLRIADIPVELEDLPDKYYSKTKYIKFVCKKEITL
jgi:hypothetical protein